MDIIYVRNILLEFKCNMLCSYIEEYFTHIVKEIREQRRSKAKTISQSKSEMKEPDPDLHRLELGVNGRPIRVLHETTQPNGMSGSTAVTHEDAQKFKETMTRVIAQDSKLNSDRAEFYRQRGNEDSAKKYAANDRTTNAISATTGFKEIEASEAIDLQIAGYADGDKPDTMPD